MEILATKSELRKRYKEKRAALSAKDVLDFSSAIFLQFQRNFSDVKMQNVHVFIPIEKLNEVKTELFIEYFLRQNIKVFAPRISGEQLEHIEIDAFTNFEVNSWGISEPEGSAVDSKTHFDAVIVPLLYCDAFGNRIGYGKGFYDRFFSEMNPDVIKIGVNFFLPNEKISDVSAHDIPLDYLVTPTEVLSFLATGRGS